MPDRLRQDIVGNRPYRSGRSAALPKLVVLREACIQDDGVCRNQETSMAEEKLKARPMSPRPGTVVVRFDQQQRRLLDFLRAEKKFGTEDGEIIRNVVLDYLKQQKRRSK